MKSPGFLGSLSNHICSSQRRHSSNWGTRFLTLLKGHLLFRQCKRCISFAFSGVFDDRSTFFPFNNHGQCLEFKYFMLVYLKPASDFGIFGEFIFSGNTLFKFTDHDYLEQEEISEIH